MEMTPGEDDDLDLLKSYRSVPREMPDAALDRRILSAASAFRARRRQLPLLLAVAACLLIALYAALPRPGSTPSVAPPSPELAEAGLYDGRVAQFLSDPEAMRQSAIRQMPGGSD
jgi:hypothetical protein